MLWRLHLSWHAMCWASVRSFANRVWEYFWVFALDCDLTLMDQVLSHPGGVYLGSHLHSKPWADVLEIAS